MAVNRTDKYRDPRWQRKRLEILQRDEWTCHACNATDKTLHVHHKYYNGNPWNVPDDALQTLCEECHAMLGKHPKGGVYWNCGPEEDAAGNAGFVVSLVYLHCPECGSTTTKDKGSWEKCLGCGYPFEWPDEFPDHPCTCEQALVLWS